MRKGENGTTERACWLTQRALHSSFPFRSLSKPSACWNLAIVSLTTTMAEEESKGCSFWLQSGGVKILHT